MLNSAAPAEIVSDKLILRWPNAQDEDAVIALLSDGATMRHLDYYVTKTPEQWTLEVIKAHIAYWHNLVNKKEGLTYYVIERKTNKLIGVAGFKYINPDHHWAEFGIILNKSSWRKSFATEIHYHLLSYAFDVLKLNRVSFDTMEDNIAMRSFFEKYHIPLEGIRKEILFNKGKYIDFYDYVLLGRYWPEVKAAFLRKMVERQEQLTVGCSQILV